MATEAKELQENKTMATEASIIDPYDFLKISLNPDGKLTRAVLPRTSADISSTTGVLTKNILINPANNTWARIFLPKQTLAGPISPNKLPLLVYFHGGGFIIGYPDFALFHEFCSNIAAQLSVMIISASYRLAPEQRLPAAYDDGMEALRWVKTVQDDWLRDHADYSNCFLMGSSAGGNLVYQVGLRATHDIESLSPLKIKGLILHQPFLGGVERTESELRLMNDPSFPQCASDLMWELSLPLGADRDHKYCNPAAGEESLEKIKRLGWKVLVTGCDGDPMINRQMEFVKMMEKKEINVVGRFGEGGCRGFELFDSSEAKALHPVLKSFMFSST